MEESKDFNETFEYLDKEGLQNFILNKPYLEMN